jgi:hypothetical protein
MTAATLRQAALGILIAILFTGCKTPDGPRFPLPPQDVSAPIPDGHVRVVFFNTSNHLLYFESGPIRIQLDGNQIPSIWLDHYAQIYAQPGKHHLLLEHYDLFMWTSEYEVEFKDPEVFLEVYNRPVSTKYKFVDELPSDFLTRFKPGRDPNNW